MRAATPADIPALHALIESAYRGGSARGGWTHEADLIDGQRTDPAQLAAMLADPAQTFLIAEIDGAPIGCVLIVDKGSCAYLGLLTVDPARQSGGLGSALVRAAEGHARALGRHTIEMRVIGQRTDLIAWYQRRGYTDTGCIEPFPYGNPAIGTPRRADLAFVILARSLEPAAHSQPQTDS